MTLGADVVSLTPVEAERRAALLSAVRYDIAVDYTDLPTGPAVRCVSTVTFACAEPGAETFVDCAARMVTGTLNGHPLPPAVGGRIRLPALAAQNTLRVETVQTDTTGGTGVHKAVDPVDGEVYVWTTFEPDAAHHVWACFDQPDLKAPHAFIVTAPDSWIVTSNSGDPEVETLDGARRWTFPATPPLSPHNTVVNAGPLHEIRREAGGYDLGIFARRSLAPVLERNADEIFTVTAQGLAFFGDAFGMPFPQRKYDQVFMPECGGTMESYGCVTWSDASLRRAAPTPAERDVLATALLHEMAHMWFGNIVTMRSWEDLWLHEALAEFASCWAASHATRYPGAWAGLPDAAEVPSIFDPKGAVVIRQLLTNAGPENFVAGLKAYIARHAWGSTTAQDLIDALTGPPADDLTLARIRPAGGAEILVAAAAELPTAVSRGVVVATVWDRMTSGEATPEQAVRCLTAVLAVETSDAVIEPYLRLAGNAAELWAGDEQRGALLAAVAEACLALAEQPGRRQVALRGLARTARDLDEVARLRVLAGDDVDLHWRALVRTAELGGATAEAVHEQLARDTDPDARYRALAVRAAAPDAGEKATVWHAMAVERTVPIGSLTAVAAAFWRPGQDALLAEYADLYLKMLPELDGAGMTPAMGYTKKLFPVFGVDADFPARAEAAAEAAAPVVRKTVRERADELHRMLRSRG